VVEGGGDGGVGVELAGLEVEEDEVEFGGAGWEVGEGFGGDHGGLLDDQ
jgi:hypothetical protein